MLDKLLEYAKTQGVSEEELNSAVQRKYRSFLEDEDIYALNKFKSLKEFTGIEPKDLPEDLVQSAYGKHKTDKHSSKLIESLTGIKSDQLSEDFVQAAYARLLDSYNGWFSSEFDFLLESTGIKPKVPEEIVQKGYLHLSEDGGKLDDFDKLRRITGVRPSDEAVQKYSLAALENRIFPYGRDRYNLDRLFELLEDTKAQLSEKAKAAVQEKYKHLLKKEKYSIISTIKEKLGIELSEEVVKLVQEEYCRLAKKASAYEMKHLKESTGVEPDIPEEAVQEGYKLTFRHGLDVFEDHNHFKDFFKFTGVKPAEELVQEMYRRSLNEENHPGWNCSYRTMLGIDLSKENKKLAEEKMISLWDVISNKRDYHIEWFDRLVESTGVEIPEEVKMKIIGEYMNAARKQNFRWFQKLTEFSNIEPPKKAYKLFLDFLMPKE